MNDMTDVDNSVDGSANNEAAERGYRKVREGLVVSDKMDKTVVVAVDGVDEGV